MRRQTQASAVYDCGVFAQTLINVDGPAGQCFRAVQEGHVTLFVSDTVLQEIRELIDKLPAKLGVTDERVEQMIRDLAKYARPVARVPRVFSYERDPDDAHYVDLAIAAKARYIVSRDNDLLDLTSTNRPDAIDFRHRFQHLRIVDPQRFLGEIRHTRRQRNTRRK